MLLKQFPHLLTHSLSHTHTCTHTYTQSHILTLTQTHTRTQTHTDTSPAGSQLCARVTLSAVLLHKAADERWCWGLVPSQPSANHWRPPVTTMCSDHLQPSPSQLERVCYQCIIYTHTHTHTHTVEWRPMSHDLGFDSFQETVTG